MNKSNHLQVSLFLLLILLSNIAYCQSDYFHNETRWVSIETKLGEQRFEVITDKNTQKANISLQYSWYNKGIINITQGYYDSYLLNGEYLQFDIITNNLIKKGNHKQGLKTGTWMFWYKNGFLSSIENWKKGVKSGKFITYNPNKQIILISNYKNNLLHGWYTQYESGVIVNKIKYKKGVIYEGGFLGIKNIKNIFPKDTSNESNNKVEIDQDNNEEDKN
ncbi:MAG: hypothetical protein QM503_03155 [Bacteroidota bacterium]